MMDANTALVVDYALSALTIFFAAGILLHRLKAKGASGDCAKGCASSCDAIDAKRNSAFTDDGALITLSKADSNTH